MTDVDYWKLARLAHNEMVRDVIRWPDHMLQSAAALSGMADILHERAEWLKTSAGIEMLALAKRHAELLEEP